MGNEDGWVGAWVTGRLEDVAIFDEGGAGKYFKSDLHTMVVG